jgi:hypothetical protein
MQEHYAKKKQPAPYTTLAGFRRARRSDDLSPAYKKWRYRNMDQNTLERWEKIKDFRNCPKILEDLQEIKYNKTNEWEVLKREHTTIEKINKKNWSASFHEKAIDTYYEFRRTKIELTDHSVARILQRGFSVEEIDNINKQSFNYMQEDGKHVKYYNNIAVIYANNQQEIVSVLRRPKPSEKWNEIKD